MKIRRRADLRRTGIFVAAAAVVAFAIALPANQDRRDPMNVTVPLRNPSNRIYSDESSVYRIESTDPGFTLIDASSQKVLSERTSEGKKIVTLAAGGGHYAASGDPGDYLYDSSLLNLSSPEIISAAAMIVPGDDPLFAVEKAVKERITRPVTGIPIVSARQVLATGSGDCTEHAVLAVAFLRSMRIPARAVVGMVLVREYGPGEHLFVYHMWAEAHYRGRWRLVDATSPGSARPNRYIAITYHSLRTLSPLSYLKAVSSVGDLMITYAGR